MARVTETELPELTQKIAAYDGEFQTGLALQFLALTFVRTGELRHAEWSESDEAKAEWRIPAEKMKMPSPHMRARVEVRQQLWAREVEIADGKRGKIKIHCVIAREVGAPAGVKPIEWRLLTNRVVQTQEQAVELIKWYRARWEIEIYFHVLKNGCEVESYQARAR